MRPPLIAILLAALLVGACGTEASPTFVAELPTLADTFVPPGSAEPPTITPVSPVIPPTTDSDQPPDELVVTEVGGTATVPAAPPTLTYTPSVTVPPTDTPVPTATTPPTATLTPVATDTVTPVPTLPGPATATLIPATVPPSAIKMVGVTSDGITELMITDRTHVVALAFLPDGRLLFTEKDGRVMLLHSDNRLYTILQLPTETDNECGMIGIAVDPTFEETGYLWTFHNVSGLPHKMEIVRFTLEGTSGVNPEVAASFPRLGGVCGHNAGNLHFGPDDMLYVTIGDNEDPANAQDLSVVPGKIHRFAPTVPLTVPETPGPFPGRSAYAYGLRNSFDFDWDPLTGNLWATENGTYCDDEINLIVPGGNFGWRPESNNACENTKVDPNSYPYILPITNWETSQAPTATLFYTGSMFPAFRNELLFCTYTNKWAQRFHLNAARTNFDSWAKIDLGEGLCESDMAQAPDGTLWFASPFSIYRLRAR